MFDSVFSPYRLFNLEQISDGLQPSFIRNLIIKRCSTLTLPLLRSPSSQLTKLRSSKQQVGELPWNSASTFHILLLSTDLTAFLNYEQIIIHICPRLVLYRKGKKKLTNKAGNVHNVTLGCTRATTAAVEK